MSAQVLQSLPAAKRRRLITLGLLRSLAVASLLLAAYYLLPLDWLTRVPLAVVLIVGLVTPGAISAFQLHSVIHSRQPGIRAIQALGTAAWLFLLLFAVTYYVLAGSDPSNFNVHTLTRTDALYFTTTVLTTVGFGDITATNRHVRLIVTLQILLNLIVLGLGVRVFIGAVQLSRERHSPTDPSPPT